MNTGYDDPYDHPELPLPLRLIAVSADLMPEDLVGVGEGDGSYDQVVGLIADHVRHTELAIADVMGLVGDWGVDDVNEAVTNALHEYRDLRAQRIAVLSVLADLQQGPVAQRLRDALKVTDPFDYEAAQEQTIEWAVRWPVLAGDQPGEEIEPHATRESAQHVATTYAADGAELVSRTVARGPWVTS